MKKRLLVVDLLYEQYHKLPNKKPEKTNEVLHFFKFSSIHGLQHITAGQTHVLESLLWAIVVTFAIFGAISTSISRWQRFQSNPTVISLERNYKDWNTSFPTITICPFMKTDLEMQFNHHRLPKVINPEKLEEFIKQLSDATYLTFDKVNDISISPTDYVDLILNSSFKFRYDSISSNLIGFDKDKKWITRTLTELGVCYMFNSKISKYFDPRQSTENSSVEEEDNSLVGNPLDGDVFAQIIKLNTGSLVYTHNSREVADIGSKGYMSPNSHYTSLQLTAVTTCSAAEVASLTISQRKCRYPHESPLLLSPVYTYNLCRMDCRLRLSYKLCRCVPYFYWNLDHKQFSICDVKGMHCLAKNKATLLDFHENGREKKDKCQCHPTCDDTNYLLETDHSKKWFFGTNLRWGIVKYPRFRYKRSILFGPTDLLVAIGGSAGLFVGCSVLSFIEIAYWILLIIVQYLKYWLNKNNLKVV